VRAALLAWYLRERRDLPWRRTRDPWAIWVSETMLQQTRVETVIPYYERFLARFPTVEALADAEPDELMQHWAGLGYYSRARTLQAGARKVAREHAGRVPDQVDALLELPGVGRYTAGALASIAFDRPAAIVDGNVARVLARLLDLDLDVKSPAGQRRLWSEAEALAAGPSPGDLNQALMELGALVCTPRAPRCRSCPLRRWCRGLAAGRAEALPVKAAKAAPRPVEAVAALLVRGSRALAVRRPPHGLLGGLGSCLARAGEGAPARGRARSAGCGRPRARTCAARRATPAPRAAGPPSRPPCRLPSGARRRPIHAHRASLAAPKRKPRGLRGGWRRARSPRARSGRLARRRARRCALDAIEREGP
jgi:A/G-specific adenine glycosylase